MISNLLTNEQIRRIHAASLTILERIGVGVPHPEMLSRFTDAGAQVDPKIQRVKIPPALVARALEQAGRQFTLYGCDLSRRAMFGQGRRNYNSIAGEASWLDRVGGQRRFASLGDVISAARIGDALPSLTIVGAMADPHEIPVEYRCVEVMATLLKHTTKPIMFWFHDRASARFLLEMMTAIRGDEQRAQEFPLCYPFFEPISPLRFPFHGIDLLFETARFNLPVPIGPMAQMGLSAPATIAGTLAQENAEILAGICITQLIRPGMPVCYGGICHAFDMATTQMIFSGPEQAIFGVAMTQMGKSYGLPVYINVGLTDAKRPDAQAGMEAGITLMLGAAAGADIFGHMGICGVDQATSLDMLVMQDEIIAYVESVMRSVDVSDETLGIDTLAEVSAAGSFIDQDHTAQHFRRELWFPRLLDRSYYQDWMDHGASGMEDRCRKRKEQLLDTHNPEPMAPEMERELDRIVAAAKKELQVNYPG
ncbi:MAG: trimethylamine methyltransferase family protein [Verrucomicrobia bacterium]|nr:trimethylamine methyltransferase family protein [Verrucomicrobiota bacterium]MCG2681423.1 trimethylamine methyltransferase family protein [Kiritimatiellia bacterium]MBU4248323.1 trimethylamine methyltransferase family protein [Verrucomicrobiota bacterium]MBU4289850.1 trimethylamine methyltransferase family protein [Verrucomicrobiota bacterium]MBU4430321.1 trimethylamine methyltransferase family protein [Verrucomicrobiota bacterium]